MLVTFYYCFPVNVGCACQEGRHTHTVQNHYVRQQTGKYLDWLLDFQINQVMSYWSFKEFYIFQWFHLVCRDEWSDSLSSFSCLPFLLNGRIFYLQMEEKSPLYTIKWKNLKLCFLWEKWGACQQPINYTSVNLSAVIAVVILSSFKLSSISLCQASNPKHGM